MQSGQALAIPPQYQLPSLEDLQNFNLDQEYAGKKNPQRRAFRVLYKKMIAQTRSALPLPEKNQESQELLASALLFEFLKIHSKYTYRSPQYSPGVFYSTGSRMWTLLNKKLRMTEMSTYKQFILLAKFYNFIKNNMANDLSDHIYWQNKQDLLNSIKPLLQALIAKHHPDIAAILSAQPPLSALTARSKTVGAEYKAKGSHAYSWFADSTSRELQILFIDFINASCIEVYGDETNCGPEQYAIRMGLFYYLAQKTGKGTLFDLSEAAMNKKFKEVSDEESFLWQTLLLGHLERLKVNHADFLRKWTGREKNFGQFINRVQAELVLQVAVVKSRQLDPAGQQKINRITRYASDCGIKFAATSATKSAVGMLGGVAIDTAAGTVGFVFGGPPGALVASQVSWLVREKLIPDAAMYFCGDVLRAISDCLGDLASSGASAFYEVTLALPVNGANSLVQSLYQFYRGIEKKEVLAEKEAYIEALMSLPPDIFAQQDVLLYTGQYKGEEHDSMINQHGSAELIEEYEPNTGMMTKSM